MFDRRITIIPASMLALFSVFTTQAATLNVDANDVACDDTSGTPYCSLRNAVTAAVSGDEILLAAGTYSGQALIDKHLTITGAGADTTFIEGGVNRRAIMVTHLATGTTDLTTVVISGVTIRGGRDDDDGGGVYNSGDLTLSDCVVTDNETDFSGGGIFNGDFYNSKLTIENCVISDNTSFGTDGSLSLQTYGGGGIYSVGELVIRNSQITGNVSYYELGGGLFIDATNFASTASIENSYFYNNSATQGGAIHNRGITTITGSTFETNRASSNSEKQGGAIHTEHAGRLDIINSTFNNNSAGRHGGAIYHNATNVTNLYNVTIVGNSASYGGGLYANSGSNITLRNSLIAGNNGATTGPDCDGSASYLSYGYNLIGDTTDCNFTASAGDQFYVNDVVDAMVADLADNGGPTKTIALYEGSPALESGDPAGCTDADGNQLVMDQRGETRPDDYDGDGVARCDIGAFEGAIASPAIAIDEPVVPVDPDPATDPNDTTPTESDPATDPTNTSNPTTSDTAADGGAMNPGLGLFMLLFAGLLRRRPSNVG